MNNSNIHIPWSKKEVDIIKKLYPTSSKKELLILLPNRTWSAIKQRAGYLKCFRADTGLAYRKCDLTPLLTKNYESLYWIGFLAADGHFSKLNRLTVCSAFKDRAHLLELSKYVSCGIIDYKKHSSLSCKHSSVVKKLKIIYSISNRKTYEPIKLPKMSINCFIAFVIGFIDGDGRLGRQYGGRKDCIIGLKMHKSWIEFLDKLSSRLSLICKTPLVFTKVNKQGYALLNIANSIVCKYLKRKTIEFRLPVLERKWGRIDLTYVSRIEKNLNDMKVVKKLLNKGLSVKCISKRTKIRDSTIYQMIRVNPVYFEKNK